MSPPPSQQHPLRAHLGEQLSSSEPREAQEAPPVRLRRKSALAKRLLEDAAYLAAYLDEFPWNEEQIQTLKQCLRKLSPQSTGCAAHDVASGWHIA